MSKRSQGSPASPPNVFQCNDHRCSVMGVLCCLNCKHQDTCPNTCPTVQQLQNPEYEGCPHLVQEANTQ